MKNPVGCSFRQLTYSLFCRIRWLSSHKHLCRLKFSFFPVIASSFPVCHFLFFLAPLLDFFPHHQDFPFTDTSICQLHTQTNAFLSFFVILVLVTAQVQSQFQKPFKLSFQWYHLPLKTPESDMQCQKKLYTKKHLMTPLHNLLLKTQLHSCHLLSVMIHHYVLLAVLPVFLDLHHNWTEKRKSPTYVLNFFFFF